MKSIKSVFSIGNGPSSSHTVGPYRAARLFSDRYPDASYMVTLYGSLALTGRGHGTVKAITSAIPDCKVKFDNHSLNIPHPNTMLFKAYKDGEEIGSARILSIGGGLIRVEGEPPIEEQNVYEEKNLAEMIAYCRDHGIRLQEYVYRFEEYNVREYLQSILHAMFDCIERGLSTEGILPGGLNINRKAKQLFEMRCYNESADITMDRLVAAFSYAACEENACGEIVVTAPTCGSCGVIPSLLYYMYHYRGFPESELIDALAVAGLIGNVISTNASISGAECGCQAEIGSACSMAAAMLATLYHLSIEQVEYAAEVAMEHSLGLTCDPVNGLVQIPCIERNAVAAMRAVNAVNLSRFLYRTRKISFDEVIATMYRTGLDLSDKYRETSHGGLATMYTHNHTQGGGADGQ